VQGLEKSFFYEKALKIFLILQVQVQVQVQVLPLQE
jgi:hypothetical protein